MRQVRLVFGSGATLLLATVLSGGCGGDDGSETSLLPSGGNGGESTQTGGQSSGGSGGASTATSTHSTMCSEPPEALAWTDCEEGTETAVADYPFTETDPASLAADCGILFYVPVAEEGTVPSASELCAQTTDEVSSGWATRVTLSPTSSTTTNGLITLAPSLVGASISKVSIAVVNQDASVGVLTLSEPTADGDGYVFSMAISASSPETVAFERLVFEVRLTLDCDGVPREIVSMTTLYKCPDPFSDVAVGGDVWISSGDACGTCSVICEMVASPISPENDGSGAALAHAVRARVTQVGQYGNSLLMQVRHDGGAGRFEYDWDVSAGEILWKNQDLMLWAPPNENAEHLVQASLLACDAAAVSSCRIRTRSLVNG